MSNGLGAAFGGAMLLVGVSGLAALLGLALVVVFVLQKRTDRVPDAVRYLTSALFTGVVLIAAFAVVALYDEAVTVAAVFLAVILVPLAVVSIYFHRATEVTGLDAIATTGLAWSIPFLVGPVVTLAIPAVINNVFDLTTGQSRQLGVYWGATVLGGILVVSGTLWLGKRVSKPLNSATAP